MRARKRKIEQLIAEILARCGVKRPPVHVAEIARSLGLQVQMYPFRSEKGEELSGILVREADRSIIGVNSSHHAHRQRFTIAHEIGHFLLHEGDRVFVDRTYQVSLRSSRSSLGTEIEEIEANTFASMLLVPEQFLIKDLQEESIDIEDTEAIARLARKYGVSPQAMSFRLANRLQ